MGILWNTAEKQQTEVNKNHQGVEDSACKRLLLLLGVVSNGAIRLKSTNSSQCKILSFPHTWKKRKMCFFAVIGVASGPSAQWRCAAMNQLQQHGAIFLGHSGKEKQGCFFRFSVRREQTKRSTVQLLSGFQWVNISFKKQVFNNK